MAHALYREILLDHYRNPRHAQRLPHPTHHADTANRSCGDRVQVQLTVVNDVVEDVGILTEGCALAVAGGSVLAEAIVDVNLDAARAIDDQQIFKLLGGIAPSPSRAQCATLALKALKDSLGS